MGDKSTITISLEKYYKLLEAQKKLSALECAGVDNWEGYSYAMREFYKDDDF